MTDTQANRRVHVERLHHPGEQPWHARAFARLACHALVRSLLTGTAVFKWLRPQEKRTTAARPARIVVTGTFFADNWVEAHVRPIASVQTCEHVWVVSDHPFVPITNVTYVCPPRWIQRLIGRVPARFLFFVVTAIRHRPDIVGGFHLLLNGLLALMVGRMLGARAMWFCVGGWAEFVNGGVHGGNHIFNKIAREDPVLERLLLSAIRQFDLILTMGTGARQYLLDCSVGARVEVMSGGIDRRLLRPHDRPRRYDLIFVSRIVPVKRIDVFLEVVRNVAERVPAVKAAVVGDGEELDKMVRLSEAMGISANVEFLGRRSDVDRWLADARLFVLTSDSEGLSLALMEAMMAGLPAVVSDVGDLGDLVANEVNGWRLPPGAVEQFADRITALLTDDQLYRRFAENARNGALAYDVHAMRGRWNVILMRWGYSAKSERRPAPGVRRRLFRSRKDLWESTTGITRLPTARLLSAVKPRIWLGARFRRNLRFANEAQHWTRDEAASYQLRMLQRVVALAHQRSPYYRNLFRSMGFEPGDLRSLDDLSKLPTMDAQTVRDHLQSMCTVQRVNGRVDYLSTAGTSGKPLSFFINSDRSTIEYAYLAASWQRAGYTLDMPMAVFRGRIVADNPQGLRYEYEPFLRHHYFSVFHMTDENMEQYLECVKRIGPCFLHVYPSSVAALARFVRRSGFQVPDNIRGIIAESEIVYPDQRHMVEEVFGCRYFSCYGHTEKVVTAAECEHSTDYHVWSTYGYFELLDVAGRPVETPGERGEIVGTGFINTLVPFIRYRTGDYATYVGQGCEACGRHQVVLRDIRGHRTQEVLIASDGAEIPWTALNMHDDTYRNVRQFQFRQDTPGRALLRIVSANGFNDDDRRRICRSLDKKLNGRLDITIELVDKIKLAAMGKAIYVDQRIAPATASAARV